MRILLQQPDAENQNSQSKRQQEEGYERQFPKIGRDFVHIDDIKDWINKIIAQNPGLSIPPIANDGARSKADEYKEVIENGEDGSKKYKDLVKIDEPEEEEEEETEEEEEE